MIALDGAEVVVMPTWVFFLIFLGGLAIITFLLWACDASRHDLRKERHRRAVHNHLHHDGPAPFQLLATGEWTEEQTGRLLERLHREGGGQ